MSVLTCFHLLCLLTPEEQSWTIPPQFPIEEAGIAPSSGVPSSYCIFQLALLSSFSEPPPKKVVGVKSWTISLKGRQGREWGGGEGGRECVCTLGCLLLGQQAQ